MSQTKVNKVVSKLRYEVGRRRRFSNPQGPEGRLLKFRQTVTALIKHERIELKYHRGDESRGYAERLISDAIRYGEKHKETMEMASYWLLEPQLVHKLFKVLVPRYQDCKFTYTRMWKAPQACLHKQPERCVLELRDNIYPSLVENIHSNNFLLHNLLLDEARHEYEKTQQPKREKAGKHTDTEQEVVFLDYEDWEEVKEMDELQNRISLDDEGDSNATNKPSSGDKNNDNEKKQTE